MYVCMYTSPVFMMHTYADTPNCVLSSHFFQIRVDAAVESSSIEKEEEAEEEEQ